MRRRNTANADSGASGTYNTGNGADPSRYKSI
jgi:hypothetical protein